MTVENARLSSGGTIMTENRPEVHSETGADELLGQILDQLTEQLRRGDTIDIAAYEREFPDQIEEIRCLLPTLKTMVGLGYSSFDRNDVADSSETDLPKEKRLGDFILFDEIGRGGMGVVYEAEQVSMNRRVALKVLPFAALLDEKAITRFQNEARAAGTLEHPNIVPRGVKIFSRTIYPVLSTFVILQILHFDGLISHRVQS